MPDPSTQKNYYEILDIDKDASEEAIKNAYKKLALKWHPDRHKDDKEDAQQKFIEINDAYTALLESIHKSRRKKREDEKSHASCSTSSSSSSTSSPSENGGKSSQRSSTSDAKAKVARDRKEGDKRPEEKPTRKSGTDRPAKSSASKPPPKRPKTPLSERTRGFTDRRTDSDTSSDEDDVHDLRDHLKHGSHSRRSRHLEDDGYEFVNLSTPLNPLRAPKSGGNLSKDWVFPLRASLEDLYRGATHNYRIKRTLQSGKTQTVKIDIKVAAGWKNGTRIRVPGVGNERKDGSFQDIVFIVEEEEHHRFERVNNDVYVSVRIPWADSHSRPYSCSSVDSRLDGDDPRDDEMAFIRGVDGEEYALPIPRSLVEAADGTRILGAGMPIRHRGEKVGRGDLVVRWDFVFPDSDKAQRSRWYNLRKAMHWKI